MIKKLLLIAFMLFGFTSILSAQDEDLDDLSFESYEYQETSPVYFVAGGGFTGSFIFQDLEPLNSEINGLNIEKSNIFMMGAEGFTAIPYLKNFRIGFSSISGTLESSFSGTETDWDVRYSLDYTSFAFNYAIIPFRSFAILPGINAGWGNVLFEQYNQDNMFRNEATFWSLKPHINLEYALAEYLMVRLAGAYSLTFLSDWKLNYDHESNISTDVNGNGMEIRFGIYVGVFTY